MNKLKIFCAVFSLIALNLFAQKSGAPQVTISGKIVDEKSNEPLEYATVVLKDIKTQQISGGITDEQGNFSIKTPKGTYDISFEFISFKTVTMKNKLIDKTMSFGTIKLAEDSSTLDEVVVIAEKTTVSIRLDKKIYNIGKDLSVRGGNASDVLGNVPSVQVDVEGNVSLRGNESVTILIDGRPSALVGLNGAEALRQIPAEAIERVEVITSPSARYDAEGSGGILNIILRKNKLIGFNGSLQLDLGTPESYGMAFNANFRNEKWNFFTNTGWRYRAVPGNAFNDSQFLNPDAENARVIEDRRFGRLGRNLFTSFGAEYFINDNSSIIANVIFNRGNDDDLNTNNIVRFASDGTINRTSIRTEDESEDEDRVQFTLDYVNNFDGKGRKLTANLQYSTEKEDIFNDILEITRPVFEFNDIELVLEEQNEDRALLQVDYVHPVGENIQYEAGYRGNYRDIFNSFFFAEVPRDSLAISNFGLIPQIDNAFEYQELVNAAYFQYGHVFNKFSLLAGLRYEHTAIEIGEASTSNSEDKSYGNLFPTLNLSYELKEGESFTLGYNRRIRRPRGRFLNPFPSRSSENNLFSGNVDLDPVLTDAFELGYIKRWSKFTLSSSIYYNISRDNWEFIVQPTGEVSSNLDPIFLRSPINLSTQERMGLELTLNYRPMKVWNINADFNLFRVTTDGEFLVESTGRLFDFDFENTAYFVRLNQKITFFKELDVQINANYRGPDRNAQSSREGIFSLNLAASKDLFKEKATISLNASDLFNSRQRRSTLFVPGDVDQYSEFQWRERQIRLSFIYRFNQKKKKSRQGRGGGDFDGGDFEGGQKAMP